MLMKKFLRITKKVILWFFALSIAWVILLRFIPVYFTPLMVIRSVQFAVKGEKVPFRHKWVSYEDISDNLKRAVIASEDQRFFDHNGFDKVQIEKAIKENKKRKRPRGASTISQQTAKNVFLWSHSSWFRKGLEVYFTGLIEICWSKKRILEVYLNCMETGKGIYGAEAVAKAHFGTSAAKLSATQSALVAATLPNPLVMNSAKPSLYVKSRQNHILRQMNNISLPK